MSLKRKLSMIVGTVAVLGAFVWPSSAGAVTSYFPCNHRYTQPGYWRCDAQGSAFGALYTYSGHFDYAARPGEGRALVVRYRNCNRSFGCAPWKQLVFGDSFFLNVAGQLGGNYSSGNWTEVQTLVYSAGPHHITVEATVLEGLPQPH